MDESKIYSTMHTRGIGIDIIIIPSFRCVVGKRLASSIVEEVEVSDHDLIWWRDTIE